MTAEPIVVAEDDPEDQLLLREAWSEVAPERSLEFVSDGGELLDYLREHRPTIIVLDLNLPVKDGRAVLRERRDDARLRRLPVVVLSTSSANEDVELVYDLGGAGYFVKPHTFDELCDTVRAVDGYWTRARRAELR